MPGQNHDAAGSNSEAPTLNIKCWYNPELVSWVEKYRGKNIHMVHVNGWETWLLPGVQSKQDKQSLRDFLQKLQELKDAKIEYVPVENTQDLNGAIPGELVIIGGALMGWCPQEHGKFLEAAGVKVEYARELQWEGSNDAYSEGRLDLYEFVLVPDQRINILHRALRKLNFIP